MLLVLALASTVAAASDFRWAVDDAAKSGPELFMQYQALHRAPELSFQEAQTAELLAKKLTALGFQVTRHGAPTARSLARTMIASTSLPVRGRAPSSVRT